MLYTRNPSLSNTDLIMIGSLCDLQTNLVDDGLFHRIVGAGQNVGGGQMNIECDIMGSMCIYIYIYIYIYIERERERERVLYCTLVLQLLSITLHINVCN